MNDPPASAGGILGDYFITAFDLVLNIYKIAHHDRAVADLRESLREREMR